MPFKDLPAKEQGIDLTRTFVLLQNCRPFMKGQKLRLLHDDGSYIPCFATADSTFNYKEKAGKYSEWNYVPWLLLDYADEPANHQAQTNEPIIKKFMNTLTKKFKELTRSEPEKSMISLGFTDEQGLLTEEGRNAFVQWMFEDKKEVFYERVVKPIKEAQEVEGLSPVQEKSRVSLICV